MMELFGVNVLLLGLFAGFGVLIGRLFGFFGMGGSFLVTPALMVMGYDDRRGGRLRARVRVRDLGHRDAETP
jgi:hypothetical protein